MPTIDEYEARLEQLKEHVVNGWLYAYLLCLREANPRKKSEDAIAISAASIVCYSIATGITLEEATHVIAIAASERMKANENAD